MVGANNILYTYTYWTYTNSAKTKTLRVKLDATTFQAVGATTTANANRAVIVSNRNAINSQIGTSTTLSGGYGTSGAGPATGSVDFTNDVTVTFTGQLTDSGESIIQRSASVILVKNSI